MGVVSRAGIGSTFWVELPMAMANTVEIATQSEQSLRLPDASMPGRCVLCIDDEPANLRLIAEMLAMRPHIKLLTADTAKRGIELAVAQQSDLILLDLNMPVMDGYKVLQTLVLQPHLRSIPIIAVSANAMPRDFECGRVAGFYEYLTKPLNLKAFLMTIDRYLARAGETKA